MSKKDLIDSAHVSGHKLQDPVAFIRSVRALREISRTLQCTQNLVHCLQKVLKIVLHVCLRDTREICGWLSTSVGESRCFLERVSDPYSDITTRETIKVKVDREQSRASYASAQEQDNMQTIKATVSDPDRLLVHTDV